MPKHGVKECHTSVYFVIYLWSNDTFVNFLNQKIHQVGVTQSKLHPTTHKIDTNAQQYIYIYIWKQAGCIILQQLDEWIHKFDTLSQCS